MGPLLSPINDWWSGKRSFDRPASLNAVLDARVGQARAARPFSNAVAFSTMFKDVVSLHVVLLFTRGRPSTILRTIAHEIVFSFKRLPGRAWSDIPRKGLKVIPSGVD
jgi:hypothetical protein